LDVAIGDTLIELAEAADLEDSLMLARALTRKPRKGEEREKLRNFARKLLERFPDEADLAIAVATMLLRSGTLGEAHETLRQIKRGFPDEERVHELLGEVLMRMGDPRGAVIAFERSLTVAPNVAVEEVVVEARVLARTQDGRPPEAVAADAKDVLGDPSEPLAVRRRAPDAGGKALATHDVRSLIDGIRPATPGRTSYRSRAITGPERSNVSLSAPPVARMSVPSTGRASVPPSASIPPPAPDQPLPRARDEETGISRRTLLGVGAVAVALGAAGLFAVRSFSEGIGLDRAVVTLAVDAMLTAKPSQLDRATTLLRRALVGAPRSSEAGVRAMQASILGLLDGRESLGGLDAAIEEAKARGAASPEVAAGEALLLVLRNDAAGAKAKLEGVEPAGSLIDAVTLHIVRGVVLERLGDPTALASYEAALAADPKAVAAAVRLTRARIVEGDVDATKKLVEKISALPDQGALASALETLARATGLAIGGSAPTDGRPPKLGDDLPKSLQAAGLALSALASSDRQQSAAMFGAAALAAETATDAALLGLIALRGAHWGSASFAASRANELGAGDPRGAFVVALVAYVNGDLARVQATAKRLPERLAATCAALLAYEDGDLVALRAAVPKVAAPYAAALQLAVARLSGERAIKPVELVGAVMSGFVGQLVAFDGYLDIGDRDSLEAAAMIQKIWPSEGRGAVRAPRVARLLRLRGDKAGARAALHEAPDAASPGALLEAVLLRDKSEVATLRARVDGAEGTSGPWLRALERATGKDSAGAKKLLKGVALPGPEAPVTERLAAVLALGATGEAAKAKVLAKPLVTLWPENADLARAAKRGGDEDEVEAEAPAPGAAAAPAPGKAPGKAPADDSDPY
jgi:tetratricopeptide (TPR) repeat protein